jgi:thiol:disulfide interchange protein
MFKFLSLFIGLFFATNAIAQEAPVAKFTTTVKDLSPTEKIVSITAKADKGIKIISTKFINADLPVNTVISFDTATKRYIKDSIKELGVPMLLTGDGITEFKINAYDSVTWEQKITLNPKDSIRFKGEVIYYYQDATGAVNSANETISKQVFASAEVIKSTIPINKDLNDKSLLGLFIAGLIAGLIGFLTPCVYALVPVTISMFLKRSKTTTEGRNNVLVYALSILVIYTLIGLLTGIVIPETAIYKISTHWIFNLFIFILFIIFGVSFLGAFEISLPASWAGKMDKKANTKSYSGIFFMAFTLVIVSFSCTGPFVGSLLATSFTQGKLGPSLGMFGFGLGLAAPFAIFAIFPKLLTVLTKSGGWQNALKVSLGFIELALALKFLSNADGVKGWRLLDREIFLVLWIIIFILLGVYLLGKLRFKHDSELPKNDWGLEYIPVPRLILAMLSLCFALYMIPGLWGAPLKSISSFLPAAGTQDFNLLRNNGVASTGTHTSTETAQPPTRYVDFLKSQEPSAAIENGFEIYYDYKEALAASKKLKKPLLLDFTGITCVNCRKFEGAIWTNKEVAAIMKNDFVLASLYVDHKAELNDNEKYFSERLKQEITTLADFNIDLQLKLVNSNTQPNYVFVDNEAKLLYPTGYGYEPSESTKAFIERLELVKSEYKKRNP